MTTYALHAPDHRPQAMGDWSEYRVASLREALYTARELNAGIFTITTPDGVGIDVEYDGRTFRTLSRDHMPPTGMTTTTTYGRTASGCEYSIDGMHTVEWLTVPAMTYDGSFMAGYDAHERGFCWDCDQRFMR